MDDKEGMVGIERERETERKYRALKRVLDEKARRLWAGAEARALGHGGIAAVARATGMAESTVRIGQEEVTKPGRRKSESRIRQAGGGRKAVEERDPELLNVLERLVDAGTRGDPMSPLKWTCKSTRNLAEELCRAGYGVQYRTVGRLLTDIGYSLQGTRKTKEGSQNPDRDAQFNHINNRVKMFQQEGQPVVSVDCKKKENVGDFSNKGQEYHRKGHPDNVRVYDFIDEELGKALPYGVYDLSKNCGWVSVGTDHETAEFAGETIYRWWKQMGKKTYPKAQKLLIVADGGGSNGSRNRLWKVEVQRLATKIGIPISVSHFPPGTSKWNKIEHRMWSQVTKNWRGRPLISLEVIVNLIANTRTKTGLQIKAKLDNNKYPTKIKVSDEEIKSINLVPDSYHGHDWNYTIKP